MRIGIFGGSFNPPHKMHKNIALNLIENGYLDKVIYVPTGNKYSKEELIDSKHRYNMVKLMIQNYKNLELSDYELKNTLTYTYQTLNHFQETYPTDKIYFICGSDNLKEIRKWKNYEYILNRFKILVIKRNNDDINDILSNINSENIEVANIKLDNISSTYIRQNIMNKPKILREIGRDVFNYINQENLY